ncbi:hypothetical protein GLYMA_15G004600v4 [Glycine max]|uniref:DUF4228 domain-containing protein n=1 Tax=Glycine max TaxID=3847 RepID=K7M8R1_SOYBN|nr:hypothetical protein JHK86_041070 [Glycine max]KAG4955298.1 hypothetical protein JHK85_041678 [Glycine max]KAH1144818.1 hypothetical protein GYH30_040918 [Glycine max]KAH1207303.1 hypothetical protein GmHk_15G042445 [Glycine max]KRH09673.1 hypothetical protein GLYMA_15G004600v4 [Glycine max]
MTLSSWICVNNSKTMLLQIVHPGGHVELHDRPVTAAEIMCRYPRCHVAYPYVFQQPWAVVEPETMLMLGQKYYVVPNSTIRKLQRLSPRSSPSPSPSPAPACEIEISSSVDEIRNTQSSKEEDDVMLSTCCVFRNKSSAKQSNIYKQYSKNKSKKSEIRADVRNLSLNINNDKNGGLSHDSCFVSMFIGGRTKANASDMAKETRTSSSSAHLCDGNNTLTRKRTKDLAGNGLRSSPKNVWSSEHWQPSLESITEE